MDLGECCGGADGRAAAAAWGQHHPPGPRPQMIAKVSKMLHDSIAYALSHRPEAVEYALQFGRGLDRAKTDRFVGMYVNDLTLAYGERVRQGLERLMADAYERGLIPQRVRVEFAPQDSELTEGTEFTTK